MAYAMLLTPKESMRIFKHFIVLFLFVTFSSCDGEDEKTGFTLSDEEKMFEEIQHFITAVNDGNKELEFQFRTDSIKFWSYDKQGEETFITPEISLSQITEFQDLKCDSIIFQRDSLLGIYSRDTIESSGVISKDHITLYFNRSGLIDEVMYRRVKTAAIQHFYMDQSEISSNEYKQFDSTKYASQKEKPLPKLNQFHLKK